MAHKKPSIRPAHPYVAPVTEVEDNQFSAFPTVRSQHANGVRKISHIPIRAYQRMLELIRMGAFDHVAASALGIAPGTFMRWLRTGMGATHGPLRKLYLDVMEARNQARALAEIEVKKLDPKFWLTRGPGKSLTIVEEQETGEVEELVLQGWDDVQRVEVASTQHPNSQSYQELPGSHKSPLKEFADSLALMEELGILQLTDSFRAAVASNTPGSEAPAEAPPTSPVALPPVPAAE